MTIAGASSTLVRVLQRIFLERNGDLGGFTFRAVTTAGLAAGLTNQVTLFLYRVGVDRTRRHLDLPTQLGQPHRTAFGLELHYLLTAWGTSAEGEQTMLAACMEILDEFAVVTGDFLDPAYPWEPDTALKVSLETMSNEDMLRLWDSLEPPYQLSIPYLVRTVLLTPVERAEAGLVEARTHVWVPRVEQ